MASGALKPVQSQRWRHQELPGTAQAEQAATTEAVTSFPLAAPEPRRIVGARPQERQIPGQTQTSESEGGRAKPEPRSSPRNDPRGPRGRRG